MVEHPKFIFAHMPKTGGSFVRSILVKIFSNRVTVKSRVHIPINQLKNYTNKFIFGSIRNPFDWYVSYWGASKVGDKSEIQMLKESNGFDDFKSFTKYMLSLNKKYDKLTDLEKCKELDIGLMTYRYLYSFCDSFSIDNHKFLVDKIIYQENLRNELYEILVKDLNISEEKANIVFYDNKVNTSDRKEDYWSYYDEELIELIKYKDRIIFEKFNY